MAHPNKAMGDRAEAAVRDLILEWFPESWRTRAGFDEDRGDIILDVLGDQTLVVAIQVKDTAARPGMPEMDALAEQVRNGGSRWGAIWWKLRGRTSGGDPRKWQVVMKGEDYLALLDHVRKLHRHLDGIGADGEALL
ncbi:holliday junction resolvase [Gordonia phage Puppers]|nr:holliday junction resolvase [Gordonia phage Puppers]